MEILTWAQRKTIIQTQFISVVSKVISDGISMNVFKNKQRWKNKKNVKKRKKRSLNKNVKNVFLHLWPKPCTVKVYVLYSVETYVQSSKCLAISCPAFSCPAISCPSFSAPPSFLRSYAVTKFQGNLLSEGGGALNARGGENCAFRPKSTLYSETVWYRPVVIRITNRKSQHSQVSADRSVSVPMTFSDFNWKVGRVEPIFSFGYPYLTLVPFDLTIKFGVVTHVRMGRVCMRVAGLRHSHPRRYDTHYTATECCIVINLDESTFYRVDQNVLWHKCLRAICVSK